MQLFKKITIILLTAISTFGYSQSLEPVQDRVKYKKDFVECWKVILTPNEDEVKKAFKKFVKKRYKVKLKGKGMFSSKDVISAEDVLFTKISSKRINFYASIIDVDGQTEIKLFGNYGLSLYFNKDEYKDEFTAVRGIIVDFINTYLPNHHTELITTLTKRHEKFVKEDDNLNKRIKNNKKQIENLKKVNKDLSDKINKNKEGIIQGKENLIKATEQFNTIKKQLNSIKR